MQSAFETREGLDEDLKNHLEYMDYLNEKNKPIYYEETRSCVNDILKACNISNDKRDRKYDTLLKHKLINPTTFKRGLEIRNAYKNNKLDDICEDCKFKQIIISIDSIEDSTYMGPDLTYSCMYDIMCFLLYEHLPFIYVPIDFTLSAFNVTDFDSKIYDMIIELQKRYNKTIDNEYIYMIELIMRKNLPCFKEFVKNININKSYSHNAPQDVVDSMVIQCVDNDFKPDTCVKDIIRTLQLNRCLYTKDMIIDNAYFYIAQNVGNSIHCKIAICYLKSPDCINMNKLNKLLTYGLDYTDEKYAETFNRACIKLFVKIELSMQHSTRLDGYATETEHINHPF